MFLYTYVIFTWEEVRLLYTVYKQILINNKIKKSHQNEILQIPLNKFLLTISIKKIAAKWDNKFHSIR